MVQAVVTVINDYLEFIKFLKTIILNKILGILFICLVAVHQQADHEFQR